MSRPRPLEAAAPHRSRCRLWGAELRGVGRVVGEDLFMSRYEIFDRSRLQLKPLAERTHDLSVEGWLSLDDAAPPFAHADLPVLAGRLRHARDAGAARILMMGAH